MRQLSAEQHANRQANLLDASASVEKCLRKFTVRDYLPGQVVYNLGEYPAPVSLAPTDYDHQLLANLAEHGARLVQFHEEWNDSKRIMGADKFTSHDPDGLRRMIDLVHSLGMKIILYFSSGYFDRSDPDLRAEWSTGVVLKECYYDYVVCSPASPGWRAYLLPRLGRLLDDYGVDGLYNDLGYFPEDMRTPEQDAALEDLLGMIYSTVHERGGVAKIHLEGTKAPRASSKIYDYLWVGEGIGDLDRLREATKGYAPYVVPCPDLRRASSCEEDDLYLHSIPYAQFPLRIDGRPVTGERALVEGIDYGTGWTGHFRRIHDYYLEHPDGPYVYGWWDSPYGRPDARNRWFHYLDVYRPMVTENTWCWIEIKDSSLFVNDPPKGVVASLFVNEESYLVLANYNQSPVTISTSHEWQDRESGTQASEWTIPARKLKLFQRGNK